MTPQAIRRSEEHADEYAAALIRAADSIRTLSGHQEINEQHVEKASSYLLAGGSLAEARDIYASALQVIGLIVAVPLAAYVSNSSATLSGVMVLCGLLAFIGAHALRAHQRKDSGGFWRGVLKLIIG